MDQVEPSTEIISELTDEELEESQNVLEIFEHLLMNILADLRDEELYSPRLCYEEDEEQFNERLKLSQDIFLILKLLSIASDIKALKLTWFSSQHQSSLLRALQNNQITEDRVNNMIMFQWDQIIKARMQGIEYPWDYELPPTKITPGQKVYKDTPGRHHLGVVYPIRQSIYEELLGGEGHSNITSSAKRRFRPGSVRLLCPREIPRPRISRNPQLPTWNFYPRPRVADQEDLSDNSWDIPNEVTFPDIFEVFVQLCHSLVEQEHPSLRHIPYRRIIDNHNGPQGVARILINYVDPHVKALKGKSINGRILQDVANAQSRDFDTEGGYLDCILDDRSASYWRPYVGQAFIVIKRMIEHMRGAMKDTPDTLHYFIIWKGQGHRSMNFIRLWSIKRHFWPDYDIETPIILSNLLEMAFARAFNSLQPRILEEFFGPAGDRQVYSGLGLNVLSPLYQGFSLRKHWIYSSVTGLTSSPDPQIQAWPYFRTETRAYNQNIRQWRQGKFVTKWKDYQKMFQDSLIRIPQAMNKCLREKDLSTQQVLDLDSWLQAFTDSINHLTRTHTDLSPPIGNPQSRLGIILNYRLTVLQRSESSVPWGLRESGFDVTNSLIWFSDPRLLEVGESPQSYTEDKQLKEVILNFHRRLIMKSNLKVILLGDKSVAKNVLPPDCFTNQLTIDLYCGSLTGYVEMNETELHRVYLESPASLACLWASPGPLAQRISELFKIAAVLTRTKGIKPYFCNSASAVYKILCLYQEETEGVELITPSNLDPIVEAWLFRKGFQNTEDICRLQSIGGTLVRGLMLLLHVLRATPRRFKRNLVARMPGQRSTHAKGILQKDALQSMKDLWRELNKGNGFVEEILDDTPTPVDDTLEMNELDDLIEEALGTLDERKEQEMFNLVKIRKQHMLTGCSSLEEVETLNSEMNDTPNLSSLKDLVPISDHRDGEYCCLAVSPTMANPLCLRLSHLMRRRTKRERDIAILDGVSYRGYWKPSTRSGNLVIHVAPDIAAILLSFPGQNRAEFPEEIHVKAEICQGKRHPDCWAKEVQDNDPGARLAFHVSIGQRTVYPSISGSVPVRKANTFVDWVTGVPVEIIATLPRRHINANEESIVKALGLPRKGTYYTDTQGNLVRSNGESSV